MPGKFIWYELITNDIAGAAAFYGKVAGWSVQDSGGPGPEYKFFAAAGVMVGGLMAIPADAAAAGMPPGWFGYVHVSDVDSTVASFTAAGGRVLMPATDIPNVGRIAMLADPQGAAIYVMTPSGEGESQAFNLSKPGHVGWNELSTTDWRAALDFYASQFGWGKTEEMDMGPMGTYLLFNAGAEAIGCMANGMSPHPAWQYYIGVASIDAAIKLVAEAGGRVLNGPHQVPGGSWIIMGQDPQGAHFALVGSR
jgi:predicted enzyme related to lactoylglutathione lyase